MPDDNNRINGNGRMDTTAKWAMTVVGSVLSAILIWFGTTVAETSRDVSTLTERVKGVKGDVSEVRTIVRQNRIQLNDRTQVLENHERRIEFLERNNAPRNP